MSGKVLDALVFGRRNPNVYLVIRVKGTSETHLIPEVAREADGRTVILSFLLPQTLAGKEFVIEVWEDCSDTDAFWKAVAAAVQVEVEGRGTVMVSPGTQAEGGIRVVVDGKELARTTLTADRFVGESQGLMPRWNEMATASP